MSLLSFICSQFSTTNTLVVFQLANNPDCDAPNWANAV